MKGLLQQQLLVLVIHLRERFHLKELFHVQMMKALGELLDPVETRG